VVGILVLLLTLGSVGGWALWRWWEPIQSWIASLGSEEDQGEDPADTETSGAPTEDEQPGDTEAEATTGEPARGFGIRGSGGDPGPTEAATGADPKSPTEAATSEGGAVDSNPKPPAAGGAAKVETLSTDIRGRVARTAVEAKLAKVDTALDSCWTKAAAAGTKGPLELELRFQIRWNRRTSGVKVSGEGVPKAVITCVRRALPGSAWPEPRDMGTAKVSRRWRLGGGV